MGKAFTPELHLEGEFLKFFRKLRRDLKANTGASDFFCEIEGDIGEMLYTAQKDGKTVNDVIGDSEDEYVEELIKTFYEANPKKSIMAIKLGTTLYMCGVCAFISFLLFNSVILSIAISIFGLFSYIIIINKINSNIYNEAIKYNKAMNYTIWLMLIPLFISGVYIGSDE
ncbi:MAG: hypothetical protein ACRDA5_01970, partial [Clostridium sp.]